MRTEEEHPSAEIIALCMKEQNRSSFEIYKYLINQGCPRELARSVLPVSTYSHMFATVNLNNLFKFCTERCHAHAQYEIRVYADAMLELIKPVVPVALNAFLKSHNYIEVELAK